MRFPSRLAAVVSLCPALILPHMAAAEEDQDLILELSTGEVDIQPNPDDLGMLARAKGKSLALESDFLPELITQSGDSALLRLANGGNSCAGDLVWLTLGADDLHVSKPFGSCAEDVKLVETNGYPAAVVPGTGDQLDTLRFDFDGKQVTQSTVQPDDSASLDRASWKGKSAYDLLSDASLRHLWLQIMSRDELIQLRDAVSLTSPEQAMHRVGDWLVGGGCNPSACDVDRAQVAIALGSGPVIAVYGDDEKPVFYGKDAEKTFRSFAKSHKPPANLSLTGNWTAIVLNDKSIGDTVTVDYSTSTWKFGPGNAVAGFAICNSWSGKIARDGTSFRIKDFKVSDEDCPYDGALEKEYLDVVRNAHILEVYGDDIELRTAKGEYLMIARDQ